jgi:hypothetical protein
VRARPIDKDQSPHGEPATLAAVDDAAVGLYFSPLSAGELLFDADPEPVQA